VPCTPWILPGNLRKEPKRQERKPGDSLARVRRPAEARRASAALPPAITAQIQHSQRPSVNAANHPSGTPNAHSRIGSRYAAAPKKRASTHAVAGSAAAPIARTKMIPLDDIAAPTAEAPTMPPATATPSEPTTSTWVSPKPVNPHRLNSDRHRRQEAEADAGFAYGPHKLSREMHAGPETAASERHCQLSGVEVSFPSPLG
jgi:hypothetical protein